MSVSVRSLLFPAVAVAAAGTVALSPVLFVAPGHSALAANIDVRTADVALAGIGQDIYYAITPTVQYAVGGVSYVINIVPIIGGVIAAQININYFQGIQPIVEATVNALAGVVQDPFAIVATLTTYATTLYDIGYNWVSAELRWAGLAPLPPLPPLPPVSVGESAPQPAGARAAAAVEQTSVRADLRRAARAAVADRATTGNADTAVATAQGAAQGAAEAPEVAAADTPTTVADTPTTAADTPREVRSPARATRGQAARAVRTAAADTAG